MSTRIFAKRMSYKVIANNTDEVVTGIVLPSDGVLNNVHMDVHAIAEEEVTWDHAVMYGLGGYVMPINDPDTQSSFNDLWDEFVEKDSAGSEGSFSLDEVTGDSDQEFEPGIPNWHGVFDMEGTSIKEIFKRRKLITLANAGQGAGILNVAAGARVYTPMDHFKIRQSNAVHVNSPSVALFGFSAPNMDAMTTTEQTTPLANAWGWLKYIDMAVEQAFIYILGHVETGAESPWDLALTFLADYLESTVVEEVVGTFHHTSWNVYTVATYDVSVPGDVRKPQLSSG